MVKRIALVGALIASCGGDGGGESIEGSWALYSDGCMVGVAFSDDGRVAQGLQCELDDGSIGIDAVLGTYELDGGELVMRAEQQTCPVEPGDDEPERIKYTVDGDSLTLFFADGIVTLERVEDAYDGAGLWEYGCFNGDTFTPGELRDI